MLNDPATVRRVRELQTEDLRILLCLLQTVARMGVDPVRFDHSDRENRADT